MENSNDALLVSKDSEIDYCLQHGIHFSRLENGICLMTLGRNVADSVHTSINHHINVGSWHDESGKEGCHHLLEHLLMPPLRPVALSNDCEINATTNPYKITHYVSGPANPNHSDYGIFSVLPLIRQTLLNPLSLYPNCEQTLSTEKKVIEREIDSYNGQPDWVIGQAMYKWLFSTTNPLVNLPTGTKSSLVNIQQEDLQKIVDSQFGSNQLTISLVTDSSSDTAALLLKRLVEVWHSFDRQTSVTEIDKTLEDALSPDLSTAQIYVYKSPMNHGTVSFVYAWPFANLPYSIETFALDAVVEHIEDNVFDIMRTNGWSYHCDVEIHPTSNRAGVITIMVEVESQDQKSLELLQKIMFTEIKKALTPPQVVISNITNKIEKRHLVWPVNARERLAWMLSGLKDFSGVINLDEISNRRLSITSNHISSWFNQLSSQSPYMGMFGDVL